MKPCCKVLWHEPSNIMAVAEMRDGLPLLSVLDDEHDGMNPFYTYSLSFLRFYGWVEIGEL